MRTNGGVLCLAAATLWLAVLPAAAQETTVEVEAGIAYTPDDSFKFGEYTGVEDSDVFAIGNVFLRGRKPWDSASTNYWEVIGTNLGLTSRYLRLEYGLQAKGGAYFEYDQVPRFQLDDSVTPFRGVGGGLLSLPAVLQRSGATPAAMPLAGNLRDLEVETERQGFGAGFKWHPSERWTLTGEFKHEHRDGTDTLAGVFAVNGGNPRSVLLPMPIDFDHDTVDAVLEYAGERLQAQLAYSGSWFDNDDEAMIWDSPWSENPPQAGGWDDIPDRGRVALPPDNQAHRVSVAAGYSLGKTTRLTGVVSYGWMVQDEDFLPYTINPDLAVPTPLPRSSLDGEIENLVVDLSARTRPLPKLELGVRYRFDDRDNDTPRDVYLIVGNDVQDQVAIDDDKARINRLYGYTQHKATVDASYRLTQSTKLQVGYDFDHWDREDYQEVETTRDHTLWARVHTAPVGFASGWLSYAHSIRNRDAYDANAPFLLGHTPEHVATVTPAIAGGRGFENHPDLRKYYLAARTGNEVSGSVSLIASEQLVFSFIAGYDTHDYEDDRFGRSDYWLMDATVDVTYRPLEEFAATAFYTHERQGIEQEGIQFNPFGSGVVAFFGNPEISWQVDSDDVVNTVGARLEWMAIPDQLDIDIEYSYSGSDVDYDIDGGTALTFEPLPDLETNLHRLRVGAEYHLSDTLSVRAFYWYEKLTNDDFALDGVEVDTIDTVLGLGDLDFDYSVHVFGLSLSYHF